MDYRDVLRRLAISGADPGGDDPVFTVAALDAKTLALVELAALIAMGGAGPSYDEAADAAISAGATVAEIVDVLVGVLVVVGRPRVVAAAPQLGMVLGYDTDQEPE